MGVAGGIESKIPTRDDLTDLHRIYEDPRVWTHFPSGRHHSLDQTAELIDQWITAWERDGLSYWIIRDSATQELLGHVGCTVKKNAFWNLGYRLDVSAQGRGIATGVSREAMEKARGLCPDLPVIAYMVEHNKASVKTARKVGLTFQARCYDAHNPSPKVVRVVYADRTLNADQLRAAIS